MVWGLFPVDPLPGEDRYYIFSKGTYKVGRKGCDIIINKDKGVSRVHAEVIIDEMICMDNMNRSSNISSKVRLRDCSKYGTFICNSLGLKEKVHEHPNKETLLKDGDLLSFGTGNATYRFCFVSLTFSTYLFKPSDMKQLQEKISSIGASISRSWTSQCTHLVINDSVSITDQIIDVIAAKKPLVRPSWVELIAGKTICTEIPNSLPHAPSLMLEEAHCKVTDQQSRECCLQGYTFLLESSSQKYKFKEKLQLLLELGGAKVVLIEPLDLDSQSYGELNGHVAHVIPTGLTCSKSVRKIELLPNVREIELVSAVLSGHLDPSSIVSAPVLVTSSCSTDETVVADSDVDIEIVTSTRTAAVVDLAEPANDICKDNTTNPLVELTESAFRARVAGHTRESLGNDRVEKVDVVKSIYHEREGFISFNRANNHPYSSYFMAFKTNTVDDTLSRGGNDGISPRTSTIDNPDIIFSQDLIVRDPTSTCGYISTNAGSVNFKRFRKTRAPSGNSFNNLVPFSKYPYAEADFGNEDVAESVKSEKKRKQMEAIADDLFNYEKNALEVMLQLYSAHKPLSSLRSFALSWNMEDVQDCIFIVSFFIRIRTVSNTLRFTAFY